MTETNELNIPNVPAPLKRYDIVERIGQSKVSVWTVELPSDFFEDFINDGHSESGDIGDMLDNMLHDSYFMSADKVEGPTTEGLMKYFYSHYESCWDYTHQVFERGLLLRLFIKNVRPDHEWMFEQPEPIHLSEVPASIRDQYRMYLADALAEHWGVERLQAMTTYTDYSAAQEIWDMYVDSLKDGGSN